MISNVKHQSGAVLVISLVLLLVLTLMGVTSMSITTSELQVASNQQAHNNSFEAALSVINTVKLSGLAWTSGPIAGVQPAPVTVSASGAGFTGTAVITYAHCMRGVAGTSLTIVTQDGDSSSSFGRVVQEIVVTAQALGSSGQTTATTTLVNGVSIKVARCP